MINSNNQIESVLQGIKDVVGSCSIDNPISLHVPTFQGTNAWSYVKNCIDTGWVSSAGSWVSRFEDQLCTVTGSKHAVAVTNGTVALRLALHLVGVRSGDEVLLPPLSFVASANAISHLGAIPHFVDVDSSSLGLCPLALSSRLDSIALWSDGVLLNRETGRRIAAILPVHVFGLPADVINLRSVADYWRLPMVEDAAEALGSLRADIHCGLFGSIGILSFNGNKLITTGGGGALITNDASLALKARHLSTTAKLPHPWAFHHDEIGWNDRMPNLNAALGYAQLEQLDFRLLLKRQLTQRYVESFSNIDGVEILVDPVNCRSNNWLTTLRFLDVDSSIAKRSCLELLRQSHEIGLLLRPIWSPLHKTIMYSSCPSGPLPHAENQAFRLVNLPSSPQLLQSPL
ncbi:MAG: aminotransferase DegT [Pelagibacteraceae bacterium TMED65]|jgi:perosamine synthetase|nr:MAG: aminotransferase DegT [Pelagibacteraceae bacterium TMED65]